MTALLQISDPHFGTERAPVVEALVRLVREIEPEAIVLSGDITQRATRAEFAAAQAFAGRLGTAPRLVIPGNHDVPLFNVASRLLAPYANHRRVFGPELEPQHRSANWFVVGVNTTRRWRHKDGDVSAAQIERVARALREASAAQMRLVVVHHPVAVLRAEDEGDLLHGHEEAVRRWAAAGADAIVGGHIHLPYVLPLHERHAGLARHIWCVQAGTAVSSRVRHEAGNSVNLLRHEAASSKGPRRAVVERWDYLPATGGFTQVAMHELALSDVPTAVP